MLLKTLLFTSGAIAAPSIISSVGVTPTTESSSLATTCAPGGNFDLSKWYLQLPTGTVGNPTTISSTSLQGCSGYSSPGVFFTDKTDGSLVMTVPGGPDSGLCVTTPHSEHCRCEFREQLESWSPFNSRNRLAATLKVTKNTGKICIGQIHIADNISTKPVAELYIDSSGQLSMGVQKCATCTQQPTNLTKVDPSQKLSYEIRYESNQLTVLINGGSFTKTLSTFDLNGPASYFKVGNYNQGEGATEVHFYSISVSHQT